tara:strand:+ start:62 stop:556 length:495 start_codon:yes stop_codon:yes gene_type:complete
MNQYKDLKKCTACHITLDIKTNFDRKETDQFSFQPVCIECSKSISKKAYRSNLSKQVDYQLQRSHRNMLNEALAQDVEETCPIKLRAMFPYFTDKQVTNMARLNEKVNAANDFLIEEQYLFLNPKERTPEGIEYRADLFDVKSDYDEDEELSIIREEQTDLDNQ